jgi:hypothetical protein
MLAKYSRKKILLYTLIIISFIVMESPFILLANLLEPTILGIPFFIFWNLLWWFITSLLFLIGYLTDWGSKSVDY